MAGYQKGYYKQAAQCTQSVILFPI